MELCMMTCDVIYLGCWLSSLLSGWATVAHLNHLIVMLINSSVAIGGKHVSHGADGWK